jgi:NDP-sugar pyrophosphorylase family protein
MTRAMLLCAGLGTRLGALSDQLPKPMLPVCDIPIVRYGIALLAGHGIRDIVINLHYRGDVIERELGDGSHLGVNIHYVHEAELLGTGGGLKNACSLLDPEGTDAPFLSLNGKLIFDLDLHALLAAFERAGDVMGMMVVRRVPDALDWGAVYVETELEVPRVCDIFGRGKYMFSGVHVTRPSVVQRLPDGEACMVRQGYLPWIREGRTVAAFVDDGGTFFAEHSTPARYLQSNLALVQGARLRCAPGALHGVHPSASIHSSAVIEPPVRIGAGAIIGEQAVVGPDAIIGAGAEIEPGARVTRAVVWRGARARGHLEQCIVTPEATIPAAQ